MPPEALKNYLQEKTYMETVTSKDGTTIAFDKSGQGAPVISGMRWVGRPHLECTAGGTPRRALHRLQLPPPGSG